MGWISVTIVGDPNTPANKRLRQMNTQCGGDPLDENKRRSDLLRSIEQGEDWTQPERAS